jgi:hypothetical protein
MIRDEQINHHPRRGAADRDQHREANIEPSSAHGVKRRPKGQSKESYMLEAKLLKIHRQNYDQDQTSVGFHRDVMA